MTPERPSSFLHRLIGAMALRPATYEEIEADPGALVQAAAVVVLASIASGLGAAGETPVAGVVVRIAIALASWTAWALVVVPIGGKILPEPQTEVALAELLRTVGFAASPGLILVLAGLPVLGPVVRVVAWSWMLAAMVVAVRQALDYRHTSRAVIVCLVGGLVAVGVMVVLGLLTAAPAL